MTVAAEPFLRAALAALDEAGDPTDVRAIVEAALEEAAPLRSIHRPPNAKKRVTWAAQQLAMAAQKPARAYSWLRELAGALWEPLAGASASPSAPAPEVAAAMPEHALIDLLAPAPRVWSREIASTAKLDATALLADASLAKRVLGVRAIPQAAIGRYATELAAAIARCPAPTATRSDVTGSTDDARSATAARRSEVPTDDARIVTAARRSDADEARIVAAEAIAICVPAAAKTRAKVATALVPYLAAESGDVRTAAIDGLRALETHLEPASLFAAMRDPDAHVRAAATRTIHAGPLGGPRVDYPPEIDIALIRGLSDIDGDVRAAVLGAIARSPRMKTAMLVEPLRALVRRGDPHDMRTAIYLLGELGAQAAAAAEDLAHAIELSTNPYQTGQALLAVTKGDASEPILATLRACVEGSRSSAAHTAAFVLGKLGVPVSEVAIEVRLARATAELASTDRDLQRSGMSEAERLGDDAKPLVPAIRAIGERVAMLPDGDSQSLLRKVRDTLGALGVEELPAPPTRLEAHLGVAPRELRVHGAYAIASVAEISLGLWDRGTGKCLFVIERAAVLELVPGRAEVAIVRTPLRAGAKPGSTRRADLEWWFERYTVPTGECVGSIAIAKPLRYGSPAQLAIAADLATVWCDDKNAPYRFHVKLGDPDVVLDEVPTLGRPSD